MILECTLGTGDAEGDHIGIMLSVGAYDTLGIAIVDETDDVIFLKEGVILEYTLDIEDTEVDKLSIVLLLDT